jgi:hypothetical protein
MVWMLFSVACKNGNIPTTRGEVYRAFTTLYAERTKEGIDLDESRILLCKIACALMQSQKPTDFRLNISEIEAQNILGSEKKLKHLLRHHLLQSSAKPGNRQISFCHQSLQEYYSAEALLIQLPTLSDVQLKSHYLNFLKWTEVIAIMLSICDCEAQTLRIIRLSLEIDLSLGARLIGEVKKNLQIKTFHSLLEIINNLEMSQFCRIKIIGQTKSELAVPILVEVLENNRTRGSDFHPSLSSSSDDIREEAIQALGRIGSKQAIDGLMAVVLYDGSRKIHRIAARELTSIRSEREIFLLGYDSDYPYDDWTRADRIVTLAIIGGDQVISDLVSALKDEYHGVRSNSAYSLKNIGSKEAIDELIAVLKEKNHPAIREVLEALQFIEDIYAIDPLILVLNDDNKDTYIRRAIPVIFGRPTASDRNCPCSRRFPANNSDTTPSCQPPSNNASNASSANMPPVTD